MHRPKCIKTIIPPVKVKKSQKFFFSCLAFLRKTKEKISISAVVSKKVVESAK